MAKRRAGSRPARPPASQTRPARGPGKRRPAPLPVRGTTIEGANGLRAEHSEAVALYEQGVAAIQARDFARASSALRAVIARYPSERTLHERVRLYLNVCERHMAPRAASPSTPEERVFAATLAVNAGDLAAAIDQLQKACTESPTDDHAFYMLASVLALLGKSDEAVSALLRAIELNPDNRAMARHDPDLESLRHYDAVGAALGPASARPQPLKAPRRSR